jgi:hypothetical protein
VPLRSTRLRDDAGPFEYHCLENSGRVAMTMYVEKDVALLAAH